MAKRGLTKTAAQQKLVDYAESLGHFLGSVRARVTTWNSERQQIVKHLSTLVADAQGLLTELGHDATRVGRRGRRALGAAVTEVRKRGRPRKRRTMSAAARKAISAAQKRRWAKVRAEKKQQK